MTITALDINPLDPCPDCRIVWHEGLMYSIACREHERQTTA